MKVSIILPIRNEQDYVSATLHTILQQETSCKFEIIISDGNSDDNTIGIVNKLLFNHPNYKLIHNQSRVVSTGFNLGLNEAKGNIIIRIDGHCEIPANYIHRCCELLKSTDADIVGGCIETISHNAVGEAISIAQSSWFGVGGVKFRKANYNVSGHVNSLAFGAHKRNIFYDIGGYDEEMICNQDDEFNYRAVQIGKKIWMDPSIKTKYYSRTTLKKLYKQYFNYGFYKVRGIQKRGKLVSIRHLIPAVFVITLIGTVILGYFIELPWLTFSVIVFYMIASVISSSILAKKIFHVPLILLSFWNLHFGYGFGFIWGLICFIGKWRDSSLKDNHFNKKQFIKNTQGIL